MLMAQQLHARVALQLVGALWTLSHSHRLETADLSGIIKDGTSLPLTLVRAIASAVRRGAPSLRWLRLYKFHVPIHQLRRVCPGRPGADLVANGQGEVCDFRSQVMTPNDLVLICRACGDLSHVLELDLSRNAFGDAGLHALIDEMSDMAPPAAAQSVGRPLPTTPLLGQLHLLGLNGCDIGDGSIARFAAAVREQGLFPELRHLSFVDNRLGDAALADLSAAFARGAFAKLVHLNLGSNDIADGGCEHFARAIEQGSLPDLLHLSLARNQVGDAGLAAIARSTSSAGCKLGLEYLGLGDNLIGDAGLIALAHAIRSGKGLSRLGGLWLGDNEKIADAGVSALASALERSSMANLYLHNTGMGTAGWQVIVCCLTFAPEMKMLVLGQVEAGMHQLIEWATCTIQRSGREMIISYSSKREQPLPRPERRRRQSPLGPWQHRSASRPLIPLGDPQFEQRYPRLAMAYVAGVVQAGA